MRRRVAVAARAIPRGTPIAPDAFTTEDRWLPPTLRAADPSSLEGQSARSRIDAGGLITESSVEPPIAVRRGDIVAVHSLAGSIIVKTRARALASGRRGEVIRFETLASERRARADRREFMARVDAPGLALITADPPPEPKP